MLDPSGAVNHSGNSVTTLIRNIAIRPRRRAGRASSRPPLEMSRPQNPAATRDDTPGVLPPPAARRSRRDPHSARTVALWERTPFPDFRRGGSPRPPPAGRAACAAARLRGGGGGGGDCFPPRSTPAFLRSERTVSVGSAPFSSQARACSAFTSITAGLARGL